MVLPLLSQLGPRAGSMNQVVYSLSLKQTDRWYCGHSMRCPFGNTLAPCSTPNPKSHDTNPTTPPNHQFRNVNANTGFSPLSLLHYLLKPISSRLFKQESPRNLPPPSRTTLTAKPTPQYLHPWPDAHIPPRSLPPARHRLATPLLRVNFTVPANHGRPRQG